jgi:hypothetical protein
LVKKSNIVEDLKRKLKTLNLSQAGSKVQLQKRLKTNWIQTCNAMKELKKLTKTDILNLCYDFIGVDADYWDLAQGVEMLEIVDSKSIDAEVFEDSALVQWWGNCSKLRELIRPKCNGMNRTVSCDNVDPVVSRLIAIPVEKWSRDDIILLITAFKAVAMFDAQGCSPAAVSRLCDFAEIISRFYVLRPDVKALIDPFVVIADIGGGVSPGLQAAVHAYPPFAAAAVQALAPDNTSAVPLHLIPKMKLLILLVQCKHLCWDCACLSSITPLWDLFCLAEFSNTMWHVV